MARMPLRDSERSRFGSGWEAAKRGDSFSTNPEHPGTWAYVAWAEGWLRYWDTLIGKNNHQLKRKSDAKDQQKKRGSQPPG